MSELIQKNDQRAAARTGLLSTVSAIALAAYTASFDPALAEDANRPTVWIEMGGQLEMIQGTSRPFTAPFMFLTPTPGPYQEDSLIDTQRPSPHAFGLEGKVSFQPENSDWIFSAGVRYGRSHTRRHVHHQTAVPPTHWTVFGYPYTKYFDDQKLADTRLLSNESHTVLDFQAGKDIGIGIFGHGGTSTVSAGLRMAEFSANTTTHIFARPSVNAAHATLFGFPWRAESFYQYTLSGEARRSFRGMGPSVSWTASADLIGGEHAHLDVDWGVDLSFLFGRQKAQVDHSTAAYYLTGHHARGYQAYIRPYPTRTNHSNRSRSVVVPNVGGFAGISMKYPNAKASLGYRADFFFGAMDTGIDTRHSQTVGFHGPFATISVGLGG